jgi:hypothetical protein
LQLEAQSKSNTAALLKIPTEGREWTATIRQVGKENEIEDVPKMYTI